MFNSGIFNSFIFKLGQQPTAGWPDKNAYPPLKRFSLPQELQPIIQKIAAQQIQENWTNRQANDELREELRLQGMIGRERETARLLKAERQRLLDEEDDIAIITLALFD